MREWMEVARKDAGLTMKDVASKLNISESYYSMIERRERQQKLDIAIVSKISDLFGISLQYIVEQEKES